MLRRRIAPRVVALLLSSSAVAAATLVSTDAPASVSIAVTWDGLLRESTAAVFATPVDGQSVWEDGRIYTYTHLRVDRPVAGDLQGGGDAWVRTMGGVVGKVGQIVEGEAAFPAGQQSLLFMKPGPAGAYVVTARAQGQFPVAPGSDPKAPAHVLRSRATGALMAPHGAAKLPLAADVVRDRAVDDVTKDIVGAWDHAHGK